MQYYKAPDNSVHFIDPAFEHLLPAGSTRITDEEAEAMSKANKPVVDPKQVIKDQIDTLERQQIMPRATREFMLLFMETNFLPEQLALNPGYQAVKTFDNQIKNLRSKL